MAEHIFVAKSGKAELALLPRLAKCRGLVAGAASARFATGAR